MLNLYVKCGKMNEAMVAFEKMQRKDLVCWSSMINGLVFNGQPREAVDAYKRMKKEGIDADEVVMMGLIQACADLGDSRFGLSVHGYSIRRHLNLDVKVQTSLVDMYAKTGHLDRSPHLFLLQLQKSEQYCGICKNIWHHSDSGNWVRLFTLPVGLVYIYFFGGGKKH